MTHHTEHRLHRRVPLRLEVEVRQGPKCLGRFATRDAGPEGAFVETGPHALRPYDVVRLTFRLGRDWRQAYEVPGLVVHCTDEGIGILHAADNPAFAERLRAALARAA